MAELFDKYRLLAPGPVPLSPEVLNSLAQPMVHHRTPIFTETLAQVHKKLRQSFQTEQPVFVLTGTGSGGLEAGLVNTLSKGDKVAAVVSGKFGERWAQMAKAYELEVQELNVTWGEPVALDEIKKVIDEFQPKALLIQASETSTGTCHPIQEIAELTRNTETLLMVDGITGVGVFDLPMDTWGIDVLVSGAQKAFMIPTGLAFIALSEKAWSQAKNSNLPKYYFDLSREKASYDKGQTLFSSSVSLIRALNITLDRLVGEELKKTISRTQLLATATRNAIEQLGLTVFSKSPSPALTAINVPEEVDGAQLRTHIEENYQVTLMGGQDHLKGKIIRIGHMGHITQEDLRVGLTALAYGLRDLNWPGYSDEKLESMINEFDQSFSH